MIKVPLLARIRQRMKPRPLPTAPAPPPKVWPEDALALAEGGEYEKALGICTKHLAARPDEWTVAAQIASALAAKSLWQESDNFFALAGNCVSSADLLFKRGEVLEKVYYSFIKESWAIGKLEAAFDCWRKSLRLDPRQLGLHMRLGSMLMVTGRIAEAREHFSNYLRIREAQREARQLGGLGIRTISCIPNGIGHITLLDYYVKMRELGLIPREETFVLLPPGARVNRAFLDYWTTWGLHLIDHPETVKWLQPFTDLTDENFNVFSCLDGEVSLVYHAIAEVERQWNNAGRSHLLELRQDHRERGWSLLAGEGIRRDDWFVTLHVRESGYTGEGDAPPNNHRNSRIETYISAIELITSAGGWVVRLGDPSMTKLPKMDRVVDYAHSEMKSDWMDVFLCAENRFYLGTSSGPCMIPPCFGKKCALANYELLSGRPFYFGNIYLPKLLWDKRRQQLLTFREILEADTAYCFHSNFFTAAGLEFVHNTAEEIAELTAEMLESFAPGFAYDDEAQHLNAAFDELGLSRNATYGTNSRIGRNFLKRYRHLLEK